MGCGKFLAHSGIWVYNKCKMQNAKCKMQRGSLSAIARTR